MAYESKTGLLRHELHCNTAVLSMAVELHRFFTHTEGVEWIDQLLDRRFSHIPNCRVVKIESLLQMSITYWDKHCYWKSCERVGSIAATGPPQVQHVKAAVLAIALPHSHSHQLRSHYLPFYAPASEPRQVA